MTAAVVTGDVHGQREPLRNLLREAELVDREGAWTGADATLWIAGDLIDNGPDGVGAIDLVMRLQREAARAGGRVDSLLGNHDVLFLAACRFGETTSTGEGGTFLAEWENSGGEPRDLERLTGEQAAWLAARPAMALEGDTLLIHADAMLYTHYGRSVDEVNRTLADLLHGDDSARWNQLLARFGEHHHFLDAEHGAGRAAAMLERYAGERIVHGHSPICSILDVPAETVREPLVYADGRCIDVDGGMYLGGPGFVYRLPAP